MIRHEERRGEDDEEEEEDEARWKGSIMKYLTRRMGDD